MSYKPFTKKDFVSFVEFVQFCKANNFKTSDEFRFFKKPDNIPSNPNIVYKEWKGWAFITNSGGKTRWLPFKEARQYMHSVGLRGRIAWLEWEKAGNRPHNIPANPYKAYGKQWTDWNDFLGTNYNKYDKSKLYAIMSKVKLRDDWSKKGMEKHGIDLPTNIPLSIKHVYPKQWEGMKSFLGTRPVPYNEFIEFLKTNNIMCQRELSQFLKTNPQKGIKTNPYYYYPGKWEGWVLFKKRFK